jgi:pimeloyl-ACP methyl ester carboxylesterase
MTATDGVTFVLVHGAWHGAWCWDRLVPELASRGHRSVAMDLPVDDAAATFDDYAREVLNAYPSDLEPVVLVGHSLGAMVLPLVAEARPAALAVYLCAVVPNPGGMPWDDAPTMGLPGAYATQARADGAMVFPTLQSAVATFYADCAPEDARWAFEHLRPQRSASLWDRPYPLERLPGTPRAAVAGIDDAAVSLAFSRAVTGPRLGTDLIEIPGGHSPFLARPAELATVLDRLARSVAG